MQRSKIQKLSVRLVRHILPERYAIQLKPDLESFTFQGEEVISVMVLRTDRTVTLHSSEIEIVTAEFVKTGYRGQVTGDRKKNKETEVWSSRVKYNEKAETVTLTFPKPLPKGKGKLKLMFRGVLNDKLRGYYRSSFTHNGQTKHLATTQFEATDARRAFPCFDEPNIKAVFEVTLVVPKHHTAISNTLPAVVREHEGGFKAVTFAPTPKMSTYLLAFISGELEYIQTWAKPLRTLSVPTRNRDISPIHLRQGYGGQEGGEKDRGTLVRVFTTPGKQSQAKFALNTAVKVLQFYEAYFGIKYPLPSLDLLAIPDFSSGAMENWGAVTFRETALLIDEENSTVASKQLVAVVIAHELAHQWFGNLVTMDWWTHLWLNEGFASYIEYLAVDHLYPQWQMWHQFMSLDYAAGMGKDQLASTHPIEVDVHHPNEIDEIFDDISYRKGSSVIRMLAEYLGEEDFRKGLAYYLKRHAYKNASTADLWIALEKVSNKPVRKIMSAWTKQPGFPLVSVSHSSGVLKLSQSRFFINPVAEKKYTGRQVWPVPISYSEMTDGDGVNSVLMTTRHISLPIGEVPKLNIGETGFFRVAYAPEILSTIAEHIKAGRLSPLDRWGIISNAWALAEAGKLSTAVVLRLALEFREEKDFTVFAEVLGGVLKLGALYKTEKWYPAYQSFVRYLLAPTVKRLGWEKRSGEAHGDTLLRGSALLAYGRNGDDVTLARGIRLFTKIVRAGTGAVPPDLRSAVYGLTAYAGGVPEFNFLKQLYTVEDLQEEKIRIARALCSFTYENLVRKALEFGFSKQVRSQDSWRFCAFVGAHSQGHSQLWKFIRQEWPTILQCYGSGGHLLSRTMESLSGLFGPMYYEQIQKFFAKHPKPGAERTLGQVLEHIQTASLWQKRDRKKVASFALNFRG